MADLSLAKLFEKHTYDDLKHFGELRTSLAVIESEMVEIKSIVIETRDQAKATNGRVNKLENWRWFLAGIGSVIVVLLIPLFLALLNIYNHIHA